MKNLHLDPIKISRIKNKHNPFLIVGNCSLKNNSSEKFFELFWSLITQNKEFLVYIDKILIKINKALRHRNSPSKNFRNRNHNFEEDLFTKTNNKFSDENSELSLSRLIELKTGMEFINEYLKENSTIIEFPDKIIHLHCYNEFSILMAETSTPLNNTRFMNFTKKIEQIGAKNGKRMRFKHSNDLLHSKRRINTGHNKNRKNLLNFKQKQRILSAKNSQLLCSQSSIKNKNINIFSKKHLATENVQ